MWDGDITLIFSYGKLYAVFGKFNYFFTEQGRKV